MARKNLTEAMVARLKPPPYGKQKDHLDALQPGLILRVNFGGKKVWRVRHYLKRSDADGKRVSIPTTHVLGAYPVLKVKEAREKARQFLADPRKALTQADVGSFREVAENFLKRHVEASKLRTGKEIERLLKRYVFPVWGERPFREIRRGDVAALLDQIEDQHGARTADYCLAVIRKCANWYATRNDDYVSPVVKGMHRNGTRKRERFLNDAEIAALWHACADLGTFGALVKTLLVTGQRREKVASMKWTDVVDGEWRIRQEPREKTNAGKLRLPPVVLAIIEAQPRVHGNPYVFGGRGDTAFNSFSEHKEELERAMPEGTERWVLHDLRRSCRKLMTRAKVRADVAELALGHSIKGIQAVYDDRAEYQPMIDEAIQRVADGVEKILNPAPVANNVVNLDPPARR
jgi:integrase